MFRIKELRSCKPCSAAQKKSYLTFVIMVVQKALFRTVGVRTQDAGEIRLNSAYSKDSWGFIINGGADWWMDNYQEDTLRVGNLAKLTWQDSCWRQDKWSDIKGKGSFLKGLSHSRTSWWKSAPKDEAWGEESSEEPDLGLDKERLGILSQALTDLSWMQISICKLGSISKAESLNIYCLKWELFVLFK